MADKKEKEALREVKKADEANRGAPLHHASPPVEPNPDYGGVDNPSEPLPAAGNREKKKADK